jgi:hypothetical protein
MAISKTASDLSFGELAALTPLVILMLVMGVAPSLWFNTIQSAPRPPRNTSFGFTVERVAPIFKVSGSSGKEAQR